MSVFFKAVRPDGCSFYAQSFRWVPASGDVAGIVVRHPDPASRAGAAGYLSVSDVVTDCTGMRWPARLLIVEPVDGAEVWIPDPGGVPHKRAAAAWRVVGERAGHELLGPQGEQLAAYLDRLTHLTADEELAIAAARDATRAAARDATRAAARDATWGLLVRDLIDDATYRTLTDPVASVLGPLHPDDEADEVDQ